MKYVIINGIKWQVEFFERHQEPYDGQTSVSNLTIKVNILQKREIIQKSLIHELVHAHLDSFGFGSYSTEQLSIEQVCEFMSFNAENIVKIANKLMEDIK